MVNKIFRRRVLEINGHKCLSKTLLYGLDGLRSANMVQWRSLTDRLGAICEMLAAFTLGKDSIDDYVEHLFTRYKVDLPVDKTYPGAIFEMLLNQNGWEHDWEWYSEDFTACPNELTIIPPSELLEVCKSNFEKSLGLNRRYLTDYPIEPVYSDKSR